MKPNLPVWRSLLYVPANVERFVEKAHTRGADCIQLDLEDSVPASEKDAARQHVPAAAKRVRQGGADVVVRINSPMDMTLKDLDASIGEDVDGIAVTKAESADHIKRIDEVISRLESTRGLRSGHTRLIAMIESPAAFFQMPAIAAASPRLAAMNIGGEDFALETGMEPSEATLLMPKQQMIFAARAAGIMPLGSSTASRPLPISRPSRAWCGVHGSSDSWARDASIPARCRSSTEYVFAVGRRSGVCGAHRRGERGACRGRPRVVVARRQMIDVPVVVRAQRLLERHAAIMARTGHPTDRRQP